MKNRELAIVGVGLHPWGVFPEKTMPEMGVTAITEALEDANMSWKEIELLPGKDKSWRVSLSGALKKWAKQRQIKQVTVHGALGSQHAFAYAMALKGKS